ncbi:hypothetical protein LUZ60_016380 [Juncus effusus]|nr:hypothetical protein LUZ60_016380 [Juncus effusus]
MLHQTLISSPSASSTFSSTISNPFLFLSFPPPLPSLSSQLEKQQESVETNMEPFKTVFLSQQNGVLSEEAVFVGERGNNTLFGGDAFSVEELLDLGEFTETQDVVITQERKEIEKRVEKGGEIDEETEENSNSSSGVTFDLPPPPAVIELPAHDAEELEWVSLIMDESLSELPATCTALPPPVPSKQRENKAKPTLCALSTESLLPAVKARRSKRSRATVWSLSGSENSGSDNSATSSCSSSSFLFYDSPFLSSSETPTFLLDDSPEPAMKKLKPKKRGRKPKAKNHHNQYSYPSCGSTTGERRCSHCGVNKTPQWRAGPEGAKTLCNACGVRYKSGRLLPEYRPACSPTFVSDLHSNSHRKVLEMRKKKETVVPVVASF